MKEASFYDSRPEQKCQCRICPHNCLIALNRTGLCRQRRNIKGKLYLANYARVTSLNMDPIEKKPIYHFYPGTEILSLGTNGCNLTCMFCQNWSISQQDSESSELTPDKAIELARQYKSSGIAYTYNEPLMWYEYTLDTARLARTQGLKNVLVTNGYINPEPLAKLLPAIDALNIDIKSIDDAFYQKLCRARVKPVLETARTAKKNALVEITNLIIPGENDRDENFEDLTSWVAENLGRETPIHFSSYYPTYKLKQPPTPMKSLCRAYQIAKKHLDHVYLGNVATQEEGDTFCHQCQTKLIQRAGYQINILKLTPEGKCGQCGAENNIVR